MTPNEQVKVRQLMLKTADDLVACMRLEADLGDIDPLGRDASKLSDLLKQKDFPSPDVRRYVEISRRIQCDGQKKAIDTLINGISRRVLGGDNDAKKEVAKKVADLLGQAAKFGLEPEFRDHVSHRLQILTETSGEGIDKRSKELARSKAAAAVNNLPRFKGIEHRRAIRYASPELLVEIDGHTYHTINWSVRGVLVDNYTGELAKGKTVKVGISCEDVHGKGREWAKVVRNDHERYALALEFLEISTVVLNLVHELKQAGCAPEQE
ncbi:putative PilZ domain-containing protein [uncultured Gammaproteobacteria bacterium]